MARQVILAKQVLGNSTYGSVVDTQFRELIPPEDATNDFISVDRFFELYEELFYEIPILGESESHEYLAKKSGEYIKGDIVSSNEQALIDEINSLRQQLLEANKSIVDISSIT